MLGPFLIIVPASLIGNWQAELASWAPALKVFICRGPAAQREAQWTKQVQHSQCLRFHLLAAPVMPDNVGSDGRSTSSSNASTPSMVSAGQCMLWSMNVVPAPKFTPVHFGCPRSMVANEGGQLLTCQSAGEERQAQL